MRKTLLALLIAVLLLTGCSNKPFEPNVSQAKTYLDLNADYDPLTLVTDVDGAGLVFEVKDNTINTATPGEYSITYKVSSADGHQSTEMTFKVAVADADAPALTCPESIKLTLGTSFSLADYATASDAREGDVTSKITFTGDVNGYVAGTYKITVIAADSYGNKASQNVTVTVAGKALSWAGTYNDTTYTAGSAPSLTLRDDGSYYMSLNSCSSISAVDGFWVQHGAKIYLTSDTFNFNAAAERNVAVLVITNQGTLSFDSELDFCAPSRGDIFTR